jgi:hypothetical protein
MSLSQAQERLADLIMDAAGTSSASTLGEAAEEFFKLALECDMELLFHSSRQMPRGGDTATSLPPLW